MLHLEPRWPLPLLPVIVSAAGAHCDHLVRLLYKGRTSHPSLLDCSFAPRASLCEHLTPEFPHSSCSEFRVAVIHFQLCKVSLLIYNLHYLFINVSHRLELRVCEPVYYLFVLFYLFESRRL